MTADAACGCDDVDVRIVIAEVSHDGLVAGQQLGPYLWTSESALWLKVPGVARFLASDGNEIRIDPEHGVDEDSIRVFLLGSVFGAILFQRKFLVLHGNAIRIGDSCMVCVGDSGAGKSTLAAAFMQRGYQILADDVVPVDSQCRAVPGFPRIKLWQDAADHLKVNTEKLRRIRPEMQKFNFPALQQFAEQPLPVRWVYILDRHQKTEILFEPIQGMARFAALHDNTYRVRFLEGMALKANHLKLCGQLAGRIHLARLTRPEQGFTVDALVERILADTTGHS
ncbi:MAG: hypothetical protein WC825_08440 [Gallionellaceae bacterium]